MTEPSLNAAPIAVDLIGSLLGEAAALAGQAHDLLHPVAEARHDLRRRLLDNNQIVSLGSSAAAPRVSIAAVDGGLVKEQMYAADLMVAVAASAEGQTSTCGHRLAQRHWAKVVAHESENDRLLSAAMASLELCVLAALSHDIRILDGSHGTPVIALATALSARSARVAEAAADLVTEDVLTAIQGLANPDMRAHPGEIVALPKADSSHSYTDTYRDQYDLDLPSGDRFLAAEILQPGEMLYPRPAKELAVMHFAVRDEVSKRIRHIAADLNYAITPLRDAAADNQILVTYVKPENADTVIKLECRVSEALPREGQMASSAVDEVTRLARILSAETIGPTMQEPFAQHMVDLEAKAAVSTGAETLKQAMLASLPPGSEGYQRWLTRSYRTK